MKSILISLKRIVERKGMTFSETLEYIHDFKKYDNITFRDLDEIFESIEAQN